MEEPAEAERPRDWEVVDEEDCGEFDIFRVRRLRSRSPRDGSQHSFHVVHSPESVVVVALTAGGRLVMVEQFRHGVRGVTLEVPGGIVDRGEPPERAALRELREETGYVADAAEIVGRVEINPAWQRARVHLAVVRDARRRAAKDEDGGEETGVRLVDPDEAWRRVRAGEVRSAVTVAALALWRDGRDGARG